MSGRPKTGYACDLHKSLVSLKVRCLLPGGHLLTTITLNGVTPARGVFRPTLTCDGGIADKFSIPSQSVGGRLRARSTWGRCWQAGSGTALVRGSASSPWTLLAVLPRSSALPLTVCPALRVTGRLPGAHVHDINRLPLIELGLVRQHDGTHTSSLMHDLGQLQSGGVQRTGPSGERAYVQGVHRR